MLMRYLVRLACNVVALYVAAWAISGITYGDAWWSLLIAAAVFTLVNMFIKPIIQLLSLPFIIVTLGLLILVINACMLLLTSWLSRQLGLGFHVDGFWTAVLGSIIISVATWLIELVVDER